MQEWGERTTRCKDDDDERETRWNNLEEGGGNETSAATVFSKVWGIRWKDDSD
jgi:hypothetical protein